MDDYVIRHKKDAVRRAESDGKIADSMAVRSALMARVRAGEITLEAAQAELAQIKRGATAAGMTTRATVFREA